MHSKKLSNELHLITLARQAKRLPHLIVAIVMVLVFVIGGDILTLLISTPLEVLLPGLSQVESASGLSLLTGTIYFVITLCLSFGIPALLLWTWLKFYEGRPFWTLGFETQDGLKKLVRGFAIGGGLFGATILIMAAFGFVAFEAGDPQRQGLAVLGTVLLTLLGWSVQASVEEILTRGWLMPVISARHNNLWLGVIVSSTLFSVLHFLNPNINLISVLNIFLVGLFLALFALWEKGIWGVCGIHIAWNWAQGNLFGFEVSGVNVPGGILINLMETGPGLMTGDAFGPEAGLAATFVLTMSTIGVWILSKGLSK